MSVSDEQIASLRAAGLNAKAIAKQLGLRPADVTPILQRLAAASTQDGPGPLVGAWMNVGWSRGLVIAENRPDWKRMDVSAAGLARGDLRVAVGLVQALVVRRGRYEDIQVSGFLVDPFGEGVKDAFGPRTMKLHELDDFANAYFHLHAGAGPVSIDVVQALVLGARDAAAKRGFEPHADFARAKALLGTDEAPAGILFDPDGLPAPTPTENP